MRVDHFYHSFYFATVAFDKFYNIEMKRYNSIFVELVLETKAMSTAIPSGETPETSKNNKKMDYSVCFLEYCVLSLATC